MKILLSLSLLISSTSFAAETPVYEQLAGKYDRITLMFVKYRVDTNTGDAWLRLTIDEEYLDGPTNTEMVSIPGLYFDKASGDIIYRGTTCATTVTSGSNINIYSTNKCQTKQTRERVEVIQNGKMKKKTRLSVFFGTNY